MYLFVAVPLTRKVEKVTCQGHIEDGTSVLEKAPLYPNSTTVVAELVADNIPFSSEKKELGALYDRWKSFIGITAGLPEDFAENHDHYAHGRPRQ